ncbi:hypothetical protein CB1_001428092 [Camelus ferus]|nr:hypothetical protein CB1_001428092 [Camelus ferus]
MQQRYLASALLKLLCAKASIRAGFQIQQQHTPPLSQLLVAFYGSSTLWEFKRKAEGRKRTARHSFSDELLLNHPMDENYNLLPHGVHFQDAIFPDTQENRRMLSSLFQFSNWYPGQQLVTSPVTGRAMKTTGASATHKVLAKYRILCCRS